MATWIWVCGEGTCKEGFKRELLGDNQRKATEEGDNIVLYQYSGTTSADKCIYGPFTATCDTERRIEPDAWADHQKGPFEYQVRVTWDEDDLHRISLEDSPVNPGKKFSTGNADRLSEQEEEELLEALRSKGDPIQVGRDGKVEVQKTDDEEGDEDEDEQEEDTDEDDEDESKSGWEDESKTIIQTQADDTNPVPNEEVLEQADEFGTEILHSAASGELQPGIYREALTHLVNGKNIVFYGPPGSGKTRISERLCKVLCSKYHLHTANAEWTYRDIVGGYKPDGVNFTTEMGIVTEAASDCNDTLEEYEHPTWLIIDEINRANLDQAFGEVFTLLDVTHRDERPLKLDDKSVKIPRAFRILSTMNTEDRAQMFTLGYAFMRRFAFIEVPTLVSQQHSVVNLNKYEKVDLELNDYLSAVRLVLEQAVVEHFEISNITSGDSVLGLPMLDQFFDSEAELDKALSEFEIEANGEEHDFITVLLFIAQEISTIVDIGQGIIIDALRYIVVYRFLFPEQADWEVVDTAVEAYFLPQIDSFMSELRRSETIAGENTATDQFDHLCNVVATCRLTKTLSRLEDAKETKEIF